MLKCRYCKEELRFLHKEDCFCLGVVEAHHCDGTALDRRRQTARLDEFDKRVATITQIRGAEYGPPRQDFERAQRIFTAITGDQGDLDPAVRHVFYMMAVKLARLHLTPTHLDSWIDIAGYARCGVTVTDDLLPGGSRYVTKS